MENLTLISAKPVLTLTSSPNPRLITTKQCFGLPLLSKNSNGSLFVSSKPRSRTVLSAFTTKNSRRKASNNSVNDSNVDLFASTSTAAQETTSVGVNPQPYVPPPSQFGSPLFWIGVGVGFSAVFSFGASWLKKYAMQQAFKSMMGQMGSQNNQFSNSAFPSGSPFGFPPPSASGSSTYPGFPYQPPMPAGPSTSRPGTSSTAPSSGAQSQTTSSTPAASVTMDVSANTPQVSEPVNDEAETKTEIKQSAFVDISPEETAQTSPFENYDDTSWKSSEAAKFTEAEVVQNGAASKEGTSGEWSQGTRKTGSMSVETFEKLMEDPKIQNMILPLLPQEMRDPATFKWMLQNPVYRQQLQDMLDNMGEGALDNQMMESLKNFDLNSPEVKEQFDQIGLTPEEAMSRIMSKPEIAMAFQNPKIQQAIMDCSANPMNIMKYQNDKEVMDVFNKIQELFPGSPGF
ncbi:protein TIC 40, chloroplastic isoform X2 [Silene latifolia]|uniref:protein TIC 40, chloroplastic isoform X2 n=1 Tax=Silene latifolia TaxID=37657 RepID=UPI003D779DAE